MEKPQFVYVTYINTTPEKLWAALTQPEFTSQYWFGSVFESDWKIGSPILIRRDGRITDEQTVLECDPPRRLAYSWHPLHDEEMSKEKPSRVTYEIEPLEQAPGAAGQYVKFTVRHDDFPDGSKVFPRISNGWPIVLSSLKSLLESGKPLDLLFLACGHKKSPETK